MYQEINVECIFSLKFVQDFTMVDTKFEKIATHKRNYNLIL